MMREFVADCFCEPRDGMIARLLICSVAVCITEHGSAGSLVLGPDDIVRLRDWLNDVIKHTERKNEPNTQGHHLGDGGAARLVPDQRPAAGRRAMTETHMPGRPKITGRFHQETWMTAGLWQWHVVSPAGTVVAAGGSCPSMAEAEHAADAALAPFKRPGIEKEVDT